MRDRMRSDRGSAPRRRGSEAMKATGVKTWNGYQWCLARFPMGLLISVS